MLAGRRRRPSAASRRRAGARPPIRTRSVARPSTKRAARALSIQCSRARGAPRFPGVDPPNVVAMCRRSSRGIRCSPRSKARHATRARGPRTAARSTRARVAQKRSNRAAHPAFPCTRRTRSTSESRRSSTRTVGAPSARASLRFDAGIRRGRLPVGARSATVPRRADGATVLFRLPRGPIRMLEIEG